MKQSMKRGLIHVEMYSSSNNNNIGNKKETNVGPAGIKAQVTGM
jgi:hypothetical protein